MKRDSILFYMANDKLHFYSLLSKREYLETVDTSLFFKYGEIMDEEKCEKVLTEILAKLNFGHRYLKPNLVVLYNDVCSADMKFLFKMSLRGFEYNKIEFVPLTKIAKLIRNDKNLVIFDKNYYTLVEKGEKCDMEKTFDFEPVIIGEFGSSHVHYADDNLVWKRLKSYFTKC